MAQEGLTKHKPDYMIFADTGWEPSFVYEHVEYLKKGNNDLSYNYCGARKHQGRPYQSSEPRTRV